MLPRHVPDNVFMTQVIETLVSPNSWPMGPWFPPIVGPWADYWGHARHVSPRRYTKPAHGRIFGDFFREPAQGRISSGRFYGDCRCNRLRCPLARMSGLQCFNMGHNGHGINLYGVSMTLM